MGWPRSHISAAWNCLWAEGTLSIHLALTAYLAVSESLEVTEADTTCPTGLGVSSTWAR